MPFYVIEPEVAGGFGEDCVIDHSTSKMRVDKLHYEFDGWLGDELLESTPCYIVTQRMANEIERTKLTGVRFDVAHVTTSVQFKQFHPNLQLPHFLWLKVEGIAGHDDFGIAPGLRLVVSERALDVLKDVGISNAASVTCFSDDEI